MRAPAGAGGQLLVAELFGPTLQGEGPSSGQAAMFVRLSRCNLSCSYCDTPYTWDWSRFDPTAEARRLTVQDVAGWVLARRVGLVVVTGGEPLIQQAGLVPLARALTAGGQRVEIETNGTLPPEPRLVEAVGQFNVSPKLAAAGDPLGRRVVPATLRVFAGCGKAVFKFVVTDPAEFDEIDQLRRDYGLDPVWVMPEGTTAEAVLAGMRGMAEDAAARGWNVSSRLHVLLWGDRRGR